MATSRDIEDRIFALNWELNDADRVVDAVVDEYGLDTETAWGLYAKVRADRGGPNQVALREAIARLERLSFI